MFHSNPHTPCSTTQRSQTASCVCKVIDPLASRAVCLLTPRCVSSDLCITVALEFIIPPLALRQMAAEEPEPLTERYCAELKEISESSVQQLQQTLELARQRRAITNANEHLAELDSTIKLLKGVHKFLRKSASSPETSLSTKSAPTLHYVRSEIDRALNSDLVKGLWAEHRYAERQRRRREQIAQQEKEAAERQRQNEEEARLSREPPHQHMIRSASSASYSRLELVHSFLPQLLQTGEQGVTTQAQQQGKYQTLKSSEKEDEERQNKAIRAAEAPAAEHERGTPAAISAAELKLPEWRMEELLQLKQQDGNWERAEQTSAVQSGLLEVCLKRHERNPITVAVERDGNAFVDCTGQPFEKLLQICNGTGVSSNATLTQLHDAVPH